MEFLTFENSRDNLKIPRRNLEGFFFFDRRAAIYARQIYTLWLVALIILAIDEKKHRYADNDGNGMKKTMHRRFARFGDGPIVGSWLSEILVSWWLVVWLFCMIIWNTLIFCGESARKLENRKYRILAIFAVILEILRYFTNPYLLSVKKN